MNPLLTLKHPSLNSKHNINITRVTIYKKKKFLLSVTTIGDTEVILLLQMFICDELENNEKKVIIKVLPLDSPGRIKTL
jgi:hypothetical protein